MIPLVKPIFGAAEKKMLIEVVNSGIIASGKYVERFEQETARYSGTRHAIAASNGTTALHAALLAAGIKSGDKVLTTPFSFIATANSILHCNAVPVFADIDPVTFNLDPVSAEKALKKNRGIKAILVVHLYGMPADMDAFAALRKKYGVLIIEDCAQAHGAKFRKKTVGGFGDASAFSYYATKNITTGEGGIILTNDREIDRRARQIINHGREGHSTHTVLGYNFRLTNIAAGFGLAQLPHLDDWNRKRRKNAAALNQGLSGLPWLTVPAVPALREPVFHQYTVRVPAAIRKSFMDYLTAAGVGNGIYYPVAIYNQPLYRELGFKPGLCPEAEKAAEEVVSLPVHPALTARQLSQIIKTVRQFKVRS